MPVEWKYALANLQLGGSAAESSSGIADSDACRQAVTAKVIVDHLRTQPGIILADEVGMGKTYVALAVIASVLASTKQSGDPIVVMVPPGLLGKWRREWHRFKAKCTVGDSLAWMDGRDKIATTPTEFFKLLNDPAGKRARLIFLKTSCFAQGLVDPWIKLALVRYARTHTKMNEADAKRIYKWAGALTLQKGRGLSADLIRHLLKSDPLEWKKRLVTEGILDERDADPVPAHLGRCKDKLDYGDLIAVLRNEIPGRSGALSTATLKNARQLFNEACQRLYWQWLQHVNWKASLLVLDEAHHAKNDSTRLAGLFRSEDLTALVEGRKDATRPDLWQKVDRMLFLTATPFQLGHDELIRVMRSFAAVRWTDAHAPTKSREDFIALIEVLKGRLNENRLAGRRLDALWGRLRPAVEEGTSANPLWREADAPADSLVVKEVKKAIAECRRSKILAESDVTEPWSGLRQWVVRHNRPTFLPQLVGELHGSPILRRVSRSGVSILDDAEVPASSDGLTIDGAAALPFLLAARAQAELAMASTRARAFFAEGLSSSYEAFHHTRESRVDVRDDCAKGNPAPPAASEIVVPLKWYEDNIEEAIPQKTKTAACFAHPKIRAVVERTIELWLTGEKVLIFAFYTETVKGLRDHLRREADRRLAELAAKRLGNELMQAEDAHEIVLRVVKRFVDPESPFHKGLEEILRTQLAAYPLLKQWHNDIYQALARYVRTPAFITRFMPLDNPAFRAAIQFGESRSNVIQAGIDAFKSGFASHVDGSGMSMRERIHRFLSFANELAAESTNKTTAHDEDNVPLLDEYLNAVLGPIQDDKDDTGRQIRSARAFGVVRAVFGNTGREARESVMLAFNSPLFPEILVSSGVLGEGVDLHRFCRHLIHHDLCWNPSSLEQRTGRLDRIHCKAEVARRPIVVYLPFIAGSADEKMYHVVKDRERWFQVVMGQEFKLDERTTETLASRVPLPPEIAAELVFDLTRWRPEG